MYKARTILNFRNIKNATEKNIIFLRGRGCLQEVVSNKKDKGEFMD